jgi:hypothetical protein
MELAVICVSKGVQVPACQADAFFPPPPPTRRASSQLITMYFRIFLMTKDEARRIAANIAKPGRRTAANLLTRRAGERGDHSQCNSA